MTSLSHDTPQLAETYDRVSNAQFEGGKRLIERLSLKVGDRVLDVGCGTGRLTQWIAERVGAAVVVGVDPLVDRVAIARARAPALTFEVCPAEDLSVFGGERFDVVCMSAVFHWVRDKPKALAEVRRVLRPGGRFGMTTTPGELRLASTTALVCGPLLGKKPYSERLDIAQLAAAWQHSTATEVITMLRDASMQLLELHIVRRTQNFARGDEVIDWLQSSSFGNFLRIVPEDLGDQFRADLSAEFDARNGAEGIVMHDYGMIVVAQR